MEKKLLKTDISLVYYGPYICRDTAAPRRKGNTGCNKRIIKAGNQASASLEFDAQPEDGLIYPNSNPNRKWRFHDCKRV